MKRKLMMAAMILCGMAMIAQEGSQNVGFYIGSANPILRERNKKTDSKMAHKLTMNGLDLGMTYETTYIAGFGMAMGLNYTFAMDAGKWNSTTTYPREKTTTYYHALSLPIDWQYKFTIAKETYLILYTGPTLDLGLSLKQKALTQAPSPKGGIGETTAIEQLYSKTYNKDKVGELAAGKEEVYDYNRFRVFWGVGAGLQYKQYFLRGGYDFGLISPYHDGFFDEKISDLSYQRRGRLDQWQIKVGIYLWQFK